MPKPYFCKPIFINDEGKLLPPLKKYYFKFCNVSFGKRLSKIVALTLSQQPLSCLRYGESVGYVLWSDNRHQQDLKTIFPHLATFAKNLNICFTEASQQESPLDLFLLLP
jgi:hypothetical protein